MKAFDTDVLTQLLRGNPTFVERAAKIPIAEQSLAIVTAEELLRGRLNVIRQAEAGKSKIQIDQAYSLFENALADLRQFVLLSYIPQAEIHYQDWRAQKIRGSTRDLRIAATCVAHSVTLVTRNRRDFERIPGLSVEFWE